MRLDIDNTVFDKTLTATFQTYWHIGTGRGSGHHVDALIERDSNGLPFVGGRTLKGLLRDAFAQAQSFGFFEVLEAPANLTELVFGQQGNEQNIEKFAVEPGLIRVSNLILDDEHIAWLSSDAGAKFKPLLTREIYSTKIDTATGTAVDKSLRGQEVAIPLVLEGTIQMIKNASQSDFAKQQAALSTDVLNKAFEIALRFVTHIGANKTRGFGRVNLEVK